jgi:hypothetical protein
MHVETYSSLLGTVVTQSDLVLVVQPFLIVGAGACIEDSLNEARVSSP